MVLLRVPFSIHIIVLYIILLIITVEWLAYGWLEVHYAIKMLLYILSI